MTFYWVFALSLLFALSALPVHSAAESAAAAVEQDPATEQSAAAGQANDAIDGFHDALLASAAQHPEVADRFAQLLPQIQQVFDTASIARLSLGRTWKTLEPGAREEFEILLAQLIAATYADRFNFGTTVRFEVLAVASGRRGPVVRCQLIRQSGAPVRLDYHLRDGKIYNVVADGVSDLSLRRADYNIVVKQQGFAALLQHIRDQLDTLIGGDQRPATDNEANS